MANSPTTITPQARLMLAALGDGKTTVEDFKVAIDLRPDLDYTVDQCEEGLEALTAAGLVKRYAGKPPTWAITKLGWDTFDNTHVQPVGPPSEVVLEPQPGIAVTSSEA